jgi:hypothetical protein
MGLLLFFFIFQQRRMQEPLLPGNKQAKNNIGAKGGRPPREAGGKVKPHYY